MKRLLCFLFGHCWRWNPDNFAVVIYDLPTAVCRRCAAELPNVMQAKP